MKLFLEIKVVMASGAAAWGEAAAAAAAVVRKRESFQKKCQKRINNKKIIMQVHAASRLIEKMATVNLSTDADDELFATASAAECAKSLVRAARIAEQKVCVF